VYIFFAGDLSSPSGDLAIIPPTVFLKPTATAIVKDHGIGSEAVRVVEPLQGGSDTRVDIR
jgi:hypothetical protein